MHYFVNAVALALAMAAGVTAADTIVFQDDFNRPDSAAVGGAWIEQNELTGTACCHSGIRIDPGYIELANNAMVFHYTKLPDSGTPSANARPYAYAQLAASTGAATLSFTFIGGTDRVSHHVGLMNAADGFSGPYAGEPYNRVIPMTGISVQISKSGFAYDNSSVEIIKMVNGVEGLVAGPLYLPFQYVNGKRYAISLTVINDRAAVSVSDGTNTYSLGPVGLGGFAFGIDQVFVSDEQGGVSLAGDSLFGFDDIVVTALESTAQRTFVATTGNDLYQCRVSAPCRSFSAAMAHTLGGGEIIVQDSGGYGPVSVDKSVSIIAPPGVYAGISVSTGQSGITINTAASDTVTLRGLTINSQGGQNGIAFTGAGTVYVDRIRVLGFKDVGAYNVNVQPTGAATLSITDSDLKSGTAGLRVSSLAAEIGILIDDTNFDSNGIAIDIDASGGHLSVRNSRIAVGSGLAPYRGAALTCESGTRLSATFDRVTIVSNGAFGSEALYTLGKQCAVNATATSVTVRSFATALRTAGAAPGDPPPHATSTLWLSDSTVTRNSNAFSDPVASFGTTLSRGNNTVEDNTSSVGAGAYSAK